MILLQNIYKSIVLSKKKNEKDAKPSGSSSCSSSTLRKMRSDQNLWVRVTWHNICGECKTRRALSFRCLVFDETESERVHWSVLTIISS